LRNQVTPYAQGLRQQPPEYGYVGSQLLHMTTCMTHFKPSSPLTHYELATADIYLTTFPQAAAVNG